MIIKRQGASTTEAVVKHGNYWFVRWEFENAPNVQIQIEVTDEEDNSSLETIDVESNDYIFNELIFNEEPTYDKFVSAYIRTKYSLDQEEAIKSNLLESIVSGNAKINDPNLIEWDEFNEYRNKAKEIGRSIFN